MTLASSIIANAWIVNYDSRIVIYSFIVLATVILIKNYNRTVIMFVNYDHKTFIVQATGNTKGEYQCTVDLLFDWFGLDCFANKNKYCQLSYS
jgi:hypothetical protein